MAVVFTQHTIAHQQTEPSVSAKHCPSYISINHINVRIYPYKLHTLIINWNSSSRENVQHNNYNTIRTTDVGQ